MKHQRAQDDVELHVGKRQRLDDRILEVDIDACLSRLYVASTFILVLNWWVEESSPLAPKEVDAVFRALDLPTLAAEA
jgi:hypothetical protein